MLQQEETPDIQQEIANSIDEGPLIEPGDFVIDVSSVLLLETLGITSEFKRCHASRILTPILNPFYTRQLLSILPLSSPSFIWRRSLLASYILTQLCCGNGLQRYMLHEYIFNATCTIWATMLQVFEPVSITCMQHSVAATKCCVESHPVRHFTRHRFLTQRCCVKSQRSKWARVT